MVGGANDEQKQPSTASMDALFPPFMFSPGPMTMVSSFYAAATNNNSNSNSNSDDYKFSQLLAVQSPMAMSMFGASFLDSPSFFSSSSPQGQFGMTHQQALAHVTAHSHLNVQNQPQNQSSAASAEPVTSFTQVPQVTTESQGNSRSEQRLQPSLANVDKPNADGYNWRKYGQKQVKGSEFPRSYYKCTHPKCPVKKKVERDLNGHITAIIYKGEHNHQCPHPGKVEKDNEAAISNSNMQGSLESTHQFQRSEEGTSDSDEGGDHCEAGVNENEDEPEGKRRNTQVRLADPASLHRAVPEPRIVVQTTSEVDLLDDGYRWRKYGQKVVKGNPYPRSYYKCTTPGCNVRKHVERASKDPRAVITTYEGKHNHDVPAAKINSHTLANYSTSQLKLQNSIPENHGISGGGVEGNTAEQPVAHLRLKQEQIT